MLTGIIRDERFLEHMPGLTHPEHPSRLRTIYETLDRHPPGDLISVAAEPATLQELELVHTPTYVKKVLRTADQAHTSLAPDTPVSSKSYLSAWLAAGGCLRALDALMQKRCQACFCLIRPPGHHALPDRAGGFCIFNNLAVTARYAASRHHIRRTLIIDYDIHHGNGLQEIFFDDPSVLYFSSHDLLLYPYSGEADETGRGAGAGYTVNLPLSRKFADHDVFFIYRNILPLIFNRFRPELILVAAGFDALAQDPIGRSRMTAECFVRLHRLLIRLVGQAGGPPLLLALEGGYHPRRLADTVRDVLAELISPGKEESAAERPCFEAEALMARVMEIHRPFGVWVD